LIYNKIGVICPEKEAFAGVFDGYIGAFSPSPCIYLYSCILEQERVFSVVNGRMEYTIHKSKKIHRLIVCLTFAVRALLCVQCGKEKKSGQGENAKQSVVVKDTAVAVQAVDTNIIVDSQTAETNVPIDTSVPFGRNPSDSCVRKLDSGIGKWVQTNGPYGGNIYAFTISGTDNFRKKGN
jgi:hypothetical protein